MISQLTAIIEREGNGYVALCPEVDVTSQGDSIEEARLQFQCRTITKSEQVLYFLS